MKKITDHPSERIPTLTVQSPNLYQPFRTITKFDGGLSSQISSTFTKEDQNETEQSNPCTTVSLSSNNSFSSCNTIALKSSTIQNNVTQALITQALISILCEQSEADEEKSKLLFQAICSQVCRLNIIPGFKMRLGPLPHYYQKTLEGLILSVKASIHRNTGEKNIIYGSQLSNAMKRINRVHLTSSRIFNDNIIQLNLIHTSRIKKDFEEVSQIAKGGGGVVYKAKCIIDHCWYAIKKIPLIIDNNYELRYEKVINEVHVLANLNHPNIVGYKTAWIDSCYETECNCGGSSDGIFPMTSDTHGNYIKSEEKFEDSIIFDDENESFLSKQVIQNEDCSLHEATSSSSSSSSSPLKNRKFSRSISYDSTSTNSEKNFVSNEPKSIPLIHNKLDKPDHRLVKKFQHPSTISNISSPLNRNLEIIIPKTHIVLIIQMELCSITLRQWLDDRNKNSTSNDEFAVVEEKEVMSIFKELLRGIEHFHSENVIHRDLKPSNIFFDKRNNRPKIGDFGLASTYTGYGKKENTDTERTCHIGTKPYASPEQLRYKDYDQKTDMYSLGIILVELLYPFKTTMEQSISIEKIKKGNIPINFLRRWPIQADLIKRLLSEDPKRRPSAKEILHSKHVMGIITDNRVPCQSPTDSEHLIAELKQSKSEIDFLKIKVQELEQSKSENESLKLKIQQLQLENDKLKAERQSILLKSQ